MMSFSISISIRISISDSFGISMSNSNSINLSIIISTTMTFKPWSHHVGARARGEQVTVSVIVPTSILPNLKGSKDSCIKALGPKDHTI